ncbi:cell wall hydrolase [Sphingomonas fuzhouensis]|uniref:cell wall hydrolase n=1 Tax=Sphingomonas fuzhouensis TaxID=3106033 RepID=UPI002AFE7916|nr:cell wall hydrolase [Sphingomonas sp. SGZ-02]
MPIETPAGPGMLRLLWEDRRGDLLLGLGLLFCAVIGGLAWLGWSPWQGDPYHRARLASDPAGYAAQVARQVNALPVVTGIPTVAPVANLDLPPDIARRINALTPFARGANPAARPFRLDEATPDRQAAEACLAAAVYYEAGSDPMGQAAVAQVVLNRVRHPAFPKTVCGVVTQGAERSTGCQFSFMCDGSLRRRVPSPAALTLAQATARWALGGGVFRAVGSATHYHADYVVPRWSGAMDKVLAFHTHLFFRWRGPAGAASLLRASPAPGERPGALAAFLSATMPGGEGAATTAADPAATTPTGATDGAPTAALPASGGVVRSDEWRGIYYLLLSPDDYPGSYAIKAVQACGKRQTCLVYGWDSARRVPVAVTEARPAGVVFVWSRHGEEQKALWDCTKAPRDKSEQCLPGTAPRAEVPATPPLTR